MISIEILSILLETPELQDSQKEYDIIKDAITDCSYGVELQPEVYALIVNKLELFNI